MSCRDWRLEQLTLFVGFQWKQETESKYARMNSKIDKILNYVFVHNLCANWLLFLDLNRSELGFYQKAMLYRQSRISLKSVSVVRDPMTSVMLCRQRRSKHLLYQSMISREWCLEKLTFVSRWWSVETCLSENCQALPSNDYVFVSRSNDRFKLVLNRMVLTCGSRKWYVFLAKA